MQKIFNYVYWLKILGGDISNCDMRYVYDGIKIIGKHNLGFTFATVLDKIFSLYESGYRYSKSGDFAQREKFT